MKNNMYLSIKFELNCDEHQIYNFSAQFCMDL